VTDWRSHLADRAEATAADAFAELRPVDRAGLLIWLEKRAERARRTRRFKDVWWQGELISVGVALGRAVSLPVITTALVGEDDVLLGGSEAAPV
jgi:hypothetical protein